MSESGPGPGTSARMKEEDKKIKLIPKNAKSMSTSAKRMQKELGEITLQYYTTLNNIDRVKVRFPNLRMILQVYLF